MQIWCGSMDVTERGVNLHEHTHRILSDLMYRNTTFASGSNATFTNLGHNSQAAVASLFFTLSKQIYCQLSNNKQQINIQQSQRCAI